MRPCFVKLADSPLVFMCITYRSPTDLQYVLEILSDRLVTVLPWMSLYRNAELNSSKLATFVALQNFGTIYLLQSETPAHLIILNLRYLSTSLLLYLVSSILIVFTLGKRYALNFACLAIFLRSLRLAAIDFMTLILKFLAFYEIYYVLNSMHALNFI